jgi:hypothetical protein
MKVTEMNLPLWKKMLVSLCVAGACCVAVASTLEAQKVESKAEAKAAAPAAKKPSRRLPNFYGDLVDGTQKEKIYAVQDLYTPQIEALAEQIKALQAKRDAEIEAVLNAEQKAKLEKAKADSKAKAAERAAAKKAAEAKTVAAEAAPKPMTATTNTTTAKPAK